MTEVTRAARRVGADPEPALAECDVVVLRSELLSAAASLDPPTLRTLDAIHLVTALSVGDELDAFVAYDERLLEAARDHGPRGRVTRSLTQCLRRGEARRRPSAQASSLPLCSASQAFATRFWARVSHASTTRSRSSSRSNCARSGMRTSTAG